MYTCAPCGLARCHLVRDVSELVAAARRRGRLAALGEPLAVIRGVGDAFSALDGELERLARPRLEAVQALRREGWTCDRIASATGLSKGQVAQLARDPRGRR